MCGINGVFAYHYAANPIDREEVVRTRDHMTARGPDGCGLWSSDDGRIGLGHRRLSIIDLSDAGAQPMTTRDGSLVVTFNGEIYNYRDLRRDLEGRGHVFRSQSDTEVLLHLYADKGAAMVHDLRGMFAFAIWDGRRRELFLARDPYGIKPLYYADDGWTFRFASQVKALVAGGAISRDPEPAGLAGFYLFGSVPEPFTTVREIRQLPAGACMRVDALGHAQSVRYHSIAATYRDAADTAHAEPRSGEGERAERLRAALQDSVRHHMIADVPVGAFLSAGIDSSTLVGLMRQASQAEISTVTLTFSEFEGKVEDEGPLAREIARHFGVRHTVRRVDRREFEADLPRILEAMDQPSIDGVNAWFVSKATSELGLKVAISGLGGDELFGGYPSFGNLPRWVRLLSAPGRLPLLGPLAHTIGQPLARLFKLNPKTAGMLELGGTYPGAYLLQRGLFLPWELKACLEPDVARQGLRRLDAMGLIRQVLEPDPIADFAKVATLESSLYMRNQLLRDTDWASMAHGLEVRVPLVDSTLLKSVAPLSLRTPRGLGKKRLAATVSPPLPMAVQSRAKTGFVTPIAKWLQGTTVTGRATGATRVPVAGQAWARSWAASVVSA